MWANAGHETQKVVITICLRAIWHTPGRAKSLLSNGVWYSCQPITSWLVCSDESRFYPIARVGADYEHRSRGVWMDDLRTIQRCHAGRPVDWRTFGVETPVGTYGRQE